MSTGTRFCPPGTLQCPPQEGAQWTYGLSMGLLSPTASIEIFSHFSPPACLPASIMVVLSVIRTLFKLIQRGHDIGFISDSLKYIKRCILLI